jgi:threonine/homoserine efflux transporter RhtA
MRTIEHIQYSFAGGIAGLSFASLFFPHDEADLVAWPSIVLTAIVLAMLEDTPPHEGD